MLLCCNNHFGFVALRVPVLIKHPHRKELVANFDPIIYQLIRETDVMQKLGLDVPEEGQQLIYMQKRLKDLHQQLIVSTSPSAWHLSRMCILYSIANELF